MSGGDGNARSVEREGEEGMWSGDELEDLITIKLTRRRSVSPATLRKLSEAFNPLALIPARDDLIVQGVKSSSCLLLLNGFAARYRLLRNGRRQFTEICLPGDFVNLGSLLKKRQPQGVVALTDCRAASIPHARLDRLIDADGDLVRSLWLDTLVDGAVSREWILALGAQSAKERLAWFLCELYCRLELVGRAKDCCFQLPMTQAEIADILGLSTVHVNRVVAELRREGLVEWKEALAHLKDWGALAALAEFDKAYLESPPE